MKSVLITAGPAWEPIDQVRRMTNLSTGNLGSYLAHELLQAGLEVTLLWGDTSSATPPRNVIRKNFSSASSLRALLEEESSSGHEAVLHLAAISDFRVAEPSAEGKRSSRSGRLTLTLEPAPKLIRHLREWFPKAYLVGWKYEVDGGPDSARKAAQNQLKETSTDACVLNGPAYGSGFFWIEPEQESCHLEDRVTLRDHLLFRLK
jgi:phosphopantothenoylcysteine synthetase/decarboxylase